MSSSPKSIFKAPENPAKKTDHPIDTFSSRPNLKRRFSESTLGERNTSALLKQSSPKSSFTASALFTNQSGDGEETPGLTRSVARSEHAKVDFYNLNTFKTPPPVSATKRPHPSQDTPTSEPHLHTQIKRQRTSTRFKKHVLDASAFSKGFATDKHTTPPSPLFFSNSPRPLLNFIPRFSSAEAGAKMLSKTHGEDTGIKTVTLARGSYGPGSPSIHRAFSTSRSSVDRASTQRTESPDITGKSEVVRMLGQIGITELLDQDDRPTFIIDLNDATNFGVGPLNVVFANSALRMYLGLLEQVSGTANTNNTGSETEKSFAEFKSWILTAVTKGESLPVCLPPFIRSSVSWSCSTLRRRLRIVSGSPLTPLPVVNSPPTSFALGSASILSEINPTSDSHGSDQDKSKLGDYLEPSDYFGIAAVPTTPPPTTPATNPAGALVSSIETPNETLLKQLSPEKQDIITNYSNPSAQASPLYLNGRLLSTTSTGDADLISTSRSEGFFDWTRLPISDSLPKHIQFARSIDWASTALGPIEHWSADLRQMCNLIMASPHPAAMYWGEDLVAMYNEAYVLLAGQKHPQLMGQSYREAWAEIWDEVKDVFASAQLTGKATMKDDDCLFIMRKDFLEETYFSWSIIPMVGSDGTVMGLYNPAFEKTRRKIAERRMLTLREVGERTATARDVEGFWDEVLAALECNDFDTPFVLLYSLYDDADNDSSSATSSSLTYSKLCYLEGALGVPPGHIAAPQSVDLKTSNEGFVPAFREVLKSNKPKVLDLESFEALKDLLQGMDWRGFGDPAKSVAVCPIHPTTGESTLGFLVMGINPRRPFDDDYNLFVQLLSRQLATSLASVVLFEEEIKRGQRAAKMAALDRIELSEQLAIRTQEAIESESKFTRMAEFAPVGMFIAGSEGKITYCNDMWYEITRVPKESHVADKWINFVMDEDKPLVRQLWRDLVENTKPATAEFRFKAQWLDRDGTRRETWVLFSAFPEKYDTGALKSVFGSVTNISQQKWAEGIQKRKMEEAVELKRQQENFIDITSHEMRNPLSAILQSADEIITTLTKANVANAEFSPTLLENTIDAAQTIALCAQHQKRIVDDVLTLSKLDSALLMVTPVDAQPISVVTRTLKMFEGELQTADIKMRFIVEESFNALGVDWVRFDPSRVLQVLINLTTNAIKFTTTEKIRNIVLTLSASRGSPADSKDGVVDFIPARQQRVDVTKGSDWGTGEEIFVTFAVKDSGRGLNTEEKKLLFLRFSQASPRTHVQYGGSGLGLFISRQLTELQGGGIGVASEAGVGSTFAFYVKARKSNGPSDSTTILPEPRTPIPASGKPSTKDVPAPPISRDFALSKDSKEVLNVLIVEDNLVNQRVLQRQLKNMGCTVHVANHGGEALERLRESSLWRGNKNNALDISVILMDQEMPIMDGLTCTKQIRELESQGKFVSHVPIIAVTANARSEQIERAMEAGMDDVVSKPFRIPELMPKIAEVVAKNRPRPKT